MVGLAVVGASVGWALDGTFVGKGVGYVDVWSKQYESQHLPHNKKYIKYSKATLPYLTSLVGSGVGDGLGGKVG